MKAVPYNIFTMIFSSFKKGIYGGSISHSNFNIAASRDIWTSFLSPSSTSLEMLWQFWCILEFFLFWWQSRPWSLRAMWLLSGMLGVHLRIHLGCFYLPPISLCIDRKRLIRGIRPSIRNNWTGVPTLSAYGPASLHEQSAMSGDQGVVVSLQELLVSPILGGLALRFWLMWQKQSLCRAIAIPF